MGVSTSGATFYRFIDPKIGLTSGALPVMGATVWQPSTAYTVGQIVRNGGFYYQCSVAGTSMAANASPASSGPSPQSLTDNTVTWVLKTPASGIYASDAAQAQEIGYEAQGLDADQGRGTAWFRYVKFSGTVNPGDFVIVDQCDGTCSQTPGSAPGIHTGQVIAISMGTQAAGTYGWVLIRGVHDQANVAASGVAGQNLSGSAVAGQATSAAQTANYSFQGAIQRATGIVKNGCVEVYWPLCTGTTGS